MCILFGLFFLSFSLVIIFFYCIGGKTPTHLLNVNVLCRCWKEVNFKPTRSNNFAILSVIKDGVDNISLSIPIIPCSSFDLHIEIHIFQFAIENLKFIYSSNIYRFRIFFSFFEYFNFWIKITERDKISQVWNVRRGILLLFLGPPTRQPQGSH